MRVLQVGPYPPPHGGVQSNLVAIREYLLRHGHSAPVINITRHRREEKDEVYYPRSAGELARLIFTLPADIIHLQIGGDLSNRLLALSLLCCSVPGRKTVMSFHSGGFPSSPQGQAANPRSVHGFVLRRFDRLIGVNQEIVEVFHRFGVAKDRTRFIYPHAIPVSEGDGALPGPLEQFFQTHSPVFVSVGGMEPEYDIPLQMNAMPALRSMYPDCGLIAVGGGSREQELRTMHDSLPDKQHFVLYGDLAHAKTLNLIRRADVFLRTTLYDGDAISVREALHYGTPVVATDNGLRPPGCILFPIGDRDGLVRATRHAIDQGRTATQSVDDANIRAVVDLYRELLPRR